MHHCMMRWTCDVCGRSEMGCNVDGATLIVERGQVDWAHDDKLCSECAAKFIAMRDEIRDTVKAFLVENGLNRSFEIVWEYK